MVSQPGQEILGISLAGQAAIVTGAGSGIGRAIAESLAASGATVLVHDIDGQRAEQVASGIAETGGAAHPFVGDISDEAMVNAMAAEAVRRWGRIDILCNNAGIIDDMIPAHKMPTELWNRVLAVNLSGPFFATRAVLGTMIEQRHGVIINMSSAAGLRGGMSAAAYTAAKAGLIGMTRNIAWTYAPDGIRCNAICPGATATDIAKGRGPADFDMADVGRLLPILSIPHRTASPQEVANLVLFLASEAAAYINGAIIPVDDALSAG